MKNSHTNSPKNSAAALSSHLFGAIGVAALVSGCGLSSHGGIIDNGNRDDGDRRKPVTHRPTDESKIPTTDEPTTDVSVLSNYVVAVPTKWAEESPNELFESNVVTFNGNSILFKEGTEVCSAKPVVNADGIDVYACTPTLSILHLGNAHFIVAKHSERNEDIDLVLYSFRRK